jgi:dTDP-4-dehydrorhamnose 3,5-epimerase
VLEVRPLALEGVLEIIPERFTDERGFFSESYNRNALAEHGFTQPFVQDNHSLSRQRGVLRGLHFQVAPFVQAKLLRVLAGSIFDVAVDIRDRSPTYGQWTGLELSAARGNQILVPGGFAHGFVTLEPDTQVFYKVTAPYSKAHERGIRFDDPEIGIKWPLKASEMVLSDKDRNAPTLAELRAEIS